MNRVFGLILFLTLLAGSCFAANVHAAADDTFQERLTAAEQAYGIARAGLQRVVDFARSRPDLFGQENPKDLLARHEKLAVWNTWSSMLSGLAALDAIRNEWNGFLLFEDETRRNASFALNQATFLASYRYALEFIELTGKNDSLSDILNEAVPELGLTADTFRRFKFRFLNVAVATEFAALQVVEKQYGTLGISKTLRADIEEDSRVIWNMGKGKGHALTFKNALDVVGEAAFRAWFPLQKNISEWMGDTKVYRKGEHLVSEEQIASMRQRLLPGDVLFERHEWYMSNMGLPGFWTHTAMYVGTPAEREKYFSDPDTISWVRSQGIESGDLELLLKQRYPEAYVISTSQLEDGHVPRILEAIAEGVSFTSLEYTGASDSIGVIRPSLSKREKAMAIVRGFHYSGRPYDFDFNFDTDSSLVCSEVVYKAYEAAPGMKGVQFPLSEIMGRKVTTPNSMVQQFDEQYGSGDAQADFVLFFDGFEKEKRAVESSLEQFRKSWSRPNWHILIQEAPEEG